MESLCYSANKEGDDAYDVSTSLTHITCLDIHCTARLNTFNSSIDRNVERDEDLLFVCLPPLLCPILPLSATYDHSRGHHPRGSRMQQRTHVDITRPWISTHTSSNCRWYVPPIRNCMSKKKLTALRQTLKNATTMNSRFAMKNSVMMRTTKTKCAAEFPSALCTITILFSDQQRSHNFHFLRIADSDFDAFFLFGRIPLLTN